MPAVIARINAARSRAGRDRHTCPHTASGTGLTVLLHMGGRARYFENLRARCAIRLSGYSLTSDWGR
jgi:hypothetical protein